MDESFASAWSTGANGTGKNHSLGLAVNRDPCLAQPEMKLRQVGL